MFGAAVLAAYADGLAWDSVRDTFVVAFKAVFTAEDARELTRSFGTPLGNRLQTQRPSLLRVYVLNRASAEGQARLEQVRGSFTAAERTETDAHRAGRLPQALEEFRRATELDFRNAEALNNVGFALYRLGRVEESVTWYRRTIAIDPDRVVAYVNLGDSLEELGKHAEAVGAYERYLELEPDGAAADRVREALGRR